jgi:hypothetical protein
MNISAFNTRKRTGTPAKRPSLIIRQGLIQRPVISGAVGGGLFVLWGLMAGPVIGGSEFCIWAEESISGAGIAIISPMKARKKVINSISAVQIR